MIHSPDELLIEDSIMPGIQKLSLKINQVERYL